ncbi:AsmA family protein [Parvibaculum sp.]|uniref:AsmA family protein n=1 Tax=Parvibaculum sp. TaxID=2024848 RepID=UPI00391C423F
MSRLIAILAGLLILIVAIIVAVPFLIPMETYKNQVASIVKEQTGRDLRIEGDIGLSFFPNIAISIEDVGLSNASWAKEKEMAAMKEMRAALKLLPLFSGNVEIDSFVLIDPVIRLEVRRDGTPNWQFETATAAAAPAEPAAGGGSGSSGAGVSGFSLGEVSIKNGRASYTNAQTGSAFEASEVNVDLALPGLDQPFLADGSLVWNGDRIAIDLKADRPRALTEGGETPVVLAVQTPKLKSNYAGALKALGGLAFAGDVKLDVTSVRELAAWAGNPMPAGDGFGPLSLAGKASGSGNTYRFTDARIAFDGMNATGNLTVDTGGARPNLRGNLDVDRINVNTYLGESAGGGSGGGSGGGDEGWSTEPIDLSGLKAVDMDFDFSTKEILFQQIKIGESALKLRLANGVLNANLSRLNLYQGAGAGTLTVNGAGATPQIAANFKLAGLAAEPFLTDAADFKRLQGATALDLAVTAAGRSQRDMVSALNGNGSVKFTDGKIKGINIAQLARNVFSAATTGWQSGGAQDTDFSEMGGTFTITNGVLKNDDLRLLSPLIRVTGAGTVNMPPKTLNYRVEPKLVASLEGQGASGAAQGIEVPILITGSWSTPRFAPDLASMIQNRDNIESTIKSIREDGGRGLIRGLMGQPAESGTGTDGETTTEGETAPAESPPAETKPRPEDALRQIFGR